MIPSPHLYRLRAPSDIPLHVIDRVLEIERTQAVYGVQSVYTLGHLAQMTNTEVEYLRDIVERRVDPYSVFEIKKRSGAARSIAAPESRLLGVQRWMLDEIFGRMKTHDASFAYQVGRSAPLAAARHLGARWLVKFDLKDFFHEIDERRIYRLLRSYRYGRLTAFELARLSTRLPGTSQQWLPARYLDGSKVPRYSWFPYGSHGYQGRLGYLPQGAPSSGAIANRIALPLDELMSEIAQEFQLTYTRYADDMVFSSSGTFARTRVARILHASESAVRKSGFVINTAKTQIQAPGRRLSVLGVLVDGDHLRVPKKVRSTIRWHLRGIESNGLAAHQEHARFRDIEGMLNYIYGVICYINDVDRHLAAELHARFRTLLPPR